MRNARHLSVSCLREQATESLDEGEDSQPGEAHTPRRRDAPGTGHAVGCCAFLLFTSKSREHLPKHFFSLTYSHTTKLNGESKPQLIGESSEGWQILSSCFQFLDGRRCSPRCSPSPHNWSCASVSLLSVRTAHSLTC